MPPPRILNDAATSRDKSDLDGNDIVMAATSEFEEFDRNAMECMREAFIGDNSNIDESLNPSK
jgi:hypothetical protein